MSSLSKIKERAWGDDDEDDEVLPARSESAPDSNGVKTVTEYRMNSAGQRVRTVKQVKVVAEVSRESVGVGQRRSRLKKFGAALTSTDESNVTIRQREEERITLENEEEPQAAAAKEAMNEFAKKQMWRKLQQKYNVSETVPEEEEETKPVAAEAPAPTKSTYVPPSLRGQPQQAGSGLQRMQSYDDREHATLRVTNISEDTAEADLQALFTPYGRIARIYLAKDRETMVSRGFAFVSYHSRDDAARAMKALQGHGYDHLILKIEWAKPSTRDPSTEGGLSAGYVSGYGKALAQDTKERVSYASNLTANR
ncbi:hypothetical protein CTAYLR_000674 [Chrysophaeum taylorii]|uniref:Eukaryotic translation initiation factor 3 subunit G n=1 Tax=Chrysophaeum taylorii TaxID=2483200 RepID=A0AAD7U962_9STRA|nr:hypothetical protein CTAYLR_000674 [Chrysophaeum taylorii]